MGEDFNHRDLDHPTCLPLEISARLCRAPVALRFSRPRNVCNRCINGHRNFVAEQDGTIVRSACHMLCCASADDVGTVLSVSLGERGQGVYSHAVLLSRKANEKER